MRTVYLTLTVQGALLAAVACGSGATRNVEGFTLEAGTEGGSPSGDAQSGDGGSCVPLGQSCAIAGNGTDPCCSGVCNSLTGGPATCTCSHSGEQCGNPHGGPVIPCCSGEGMCSLNPAGSMLTCQQAPNNVNDAGVPFCCTYVTGQNLQDGGGTQTDLCGAGDVVCGQSSCTTKGGVFGMLAACPVCSGPVTISCSTSGDHPLPWCVQGSGFSYLAQEQVIGAVSGVNCICPSGTMCGYTDATMCTAECR